MRCKDERVNIAHLRPELLQLFPVIDSVFWAWNKVPIITSGNDGHHLPQSLHYHDLAFDLRVRHLGDYAARRSLFICLKKEIDRLYPGWYDVLHENLNRESEHIHCEASPLLMGMIEGATKEVEV